MLDEPFKDERNVMVYLKTQLVPHSKHSVSVMKTNQFMLYRSKVAVLSEIHTKHINASFGNNVEFFIFTPNGTESNR